MIPEIVSNNHIAHCAQCRVVVHRHRGVFAWGRVWCHWCYTEQRRLRPVKEQGR